MSRKRSQPVVPPKGRKTDKLFVGTITVEQQRKMRKASERQERIDSGLRQTGSGVHGGYARENNRRERRQWKQDIKSDF